MMVKAFRVGSDAREKVKDIILDDHTQCGCECGEELGNLYCNISKFFKKFQLPIYIFQQFIYRKFSKYFLNRSRMCWKFQQSHMCM